MLLAAAVAAATEADAINLTLFICTHTNTGNTYRREEELAVVLCIYYFLLLLFGSCRLGSFGIL